MMGVASLLIISLTLLYAAMMTAFRYGWQHSPYFTPAGDFIPSTRISVIIPARNEEANIGACLQSIAAQKYPAELLEIILVDDHSEDSTVAVANEFSALLKLKIIRLGDYDLSGINAYKKEALGKGIAACNGNLIITTDADCVVGKDWLMQHAACYEQNNSCAIIGPVTFSPWRGLSGIFQSLDFMTMQGITAAIHYNRRGAMANGANFAFSRAAFEAVNGYYGTTHLASGDDYHLLQKLQTAFPNAVHYLKSKAAIVSTPPQVTWAGFLQQRIRWASKSGKDNNVKLVAPLALVYLFNCSLIAGALASFFVPGLWRVWLLCLIFKISIELFFLWPVSGFFTKRKELAIFPLLQPLHIAYIVLAGFLGMTGRYQWKGRSVR